MHDTAKFYGERFLDTYSPTITGLSGNIPLVLEVGAGNDVTFKNKCAELKLNYQGIDQIHSSDSDIVYKLPAANNSVDIVVSSSCFEHDEFFWVTFLEIMRVLKPHGIFYLSAPSDGVYHKYPVDCWRFYPDSANALVKWARKNRISAIVLESFTGTPINDIWKDYMCVILKSENLRSAYPNRMLDNLNYPILYPFRQ
jgi:SAM-dependent methyltransferase